ARVLNSDRIRKSLYGVPAEERLPDSAYCAEVSRQVYDRLFAEATRTLSAGASVIADAVFDRLDDRAAIEAVAAKAGVPFHGFWLEAPTETLISRIAGRVGDPSDATAEVIAGQLKHDTGAIRWEKIDARGEQASVLETLLPAVFGRP
ncbi:MAG: AAA family ATPase, partial [Beijerinckiaceae bacterium]